MTYVNWLDLRPPTHPAPFIIWNVFLPLLFPDFWDGRIELTSSPDLVSLFWHLSWMQNVPRPEFEVLWKIDKNHRIQFCQLQARANIFYFYVQVDAALDLSHTQNIGQMLRTHFKHSQFIVVSLKDGMFQNANVLFRFTCFIDTSLVISVQLVYTIQFIPVIITSKLKWFVVFIISIFPYAYSK